MKLVKQLAVCLFIMVAFAPASFAADNARMILKSMSDYLSKQKSYSLKFNTSIEVVTSDLQKVQFTSSGQLAVGRPNRIYARRTGGFADVEMGFNGKKLTIHARGEGVYAQINVAGTIDNLIEKLEAEGFALPGADLLLSDVNKALSAGILDAKHIGTGVINGVTCEHLAFRNADTDWQLWVRTGPKPVPCRYVVTSKTVTGAPQYTLTINEWKDKKIGLLSFVPPAGSKQVDVKALPHFDDIPKGTGK